MMSLKAKPLTLEKVANDLLKMYEEELIINPEHAVNEYFNTMSMQLEIRGDTLEANNITSLQQVVKKEFIPAYYKYQQAEHVITKRQQNRSFGKIWVYTLASLELAEILITKGKILHPMILLETLPINAAISGMLGGCFYGIAHLKDGFERGTAKYKLFRTIKRKDTQLQIENQYRALQQIMEGKVLGAEALKVLQQYETASDFTRAYKQARSIDPTAEHQLVQVKSGPMIGFTRIHVDGRYSEPQRQHRFDQLYLEAEKYFMQMDRNHVQKKLSQ